jgi:glycosyltransferase involved in cell wall biosynthesis
MTNYKPNLTIITVCFNDADQLEKTILSVINQTYSNYEYVIIDGASTDGTANIIKKYSDKINVWVSEPDNGIYDAMNKGLDKAKGEWVNFMNAGDTFASNTVLADVFSFEYPDYIKFLYSDNYYLRKDGTERLSVNSHTNMAIIHQSSIYRKSLHDTHGKYIVTPEIIISDNLFFNSVPNEYFKKLDTIISINTDDGISAQGLWCGTQYLCASVVFRRINISQFFIKYLKFRIKRMFPAVSRVFGKE